MSSNTIRVHPLQFRFALVSADYASAPAGSQKRPMGLSASFFLYELHSKRRTLLCPTDQWGRSAEWSRDGLANLLHPSDPQDPRGYIQIFWDGTGVQRYLSGTNLVMANNSGNEASHLRPQIAGQLPRYVAAFDS